MPPDYAFGMGAFNMKYAPAWGGEEYDKMSRAQPNLFIKSGELPPATPDTNLPLNI